MEEKQSTLMLVSDLWRRRVEWLWERGEFNEPLDIDKLDAMIVEWEEQLESCERKGKERTKLLMGDK